MKIDHEVVNFFKKHNMHSEDMFDYFENNSMMLDYNYEDHHMFIGCFPVTDCYGKLKRIQINMPYVFDDITAMISIHELTHAIMLYPMLGKKYKEPRVPEALPLLYEGLYAKEKQSTEATNYWNYIRNAILTDNNEKYVSGLKLSKELVKEYNNNPNEMLNLSKKLSKKYPKTKRN